MSKKDKSKFRKRIKEQILKEMTQAESQSAVKTAPIVRTDFQKEQPTPTVNTVPKTITAKPQESTATINYLDFIKKDLRKSAIIISSIICVIIILTIVDNRTNILLDLGNRIFQVLNIGI